MNISIYKKKDDLFLVSHAKTDKGFEIVWKNIVRIRTSPTYSLPAQLLFSIIKDLLLTYKSSVEMPLKSSDIMQELLLCAGVKSQSQLIKDANLIHLSHKDERYIIVPSIRSKEFKGFQSFNGIREEFDDQNQESAIVNRIMELFHEMENYEKPLG